MPYAEGGVEMQRARGAIELLLEPRRGVTEIARLYQESPGRVLFPRVEPDEPLTGVLLNTAGGLCGGDQLRLSVRAAAGTRGVLTSQAAERIYRSLGPECQIEVSLVVEPGASLEWLPQETILFEGARLRRKTTVEV